MIFHSVEGSGPAVVLVHGVGGDSSNWDAIALPLAATRRVIRVDLRGHGRSPAIRAPVSAEDLARDIVAVLDAQGIASCALAGFSLGGQVALALALGWPGRVARLALVSTVAGRSEAERAGAMKRIDVIREKGLAAIAAANRERWFTDEFQKRHPEQVEARVRQLLNSDPTSYLHAYTVFATADYAGRLGELRLPALIVTGEQDLAATPRMARFMHERIVGSRLEILPGLRHSLLIEAGAQIAALLGSFLPGADGRIT